MKKSTIFLIALLLLVICANLLLVNGQMSAKPPHDNPCGEHAEQLSLVILEDKLPHLLQDKWLNWKADNSYALMYEVDYAIQEYHYSIAVWYCTDEE